MSTNRCKRRKSSGGFTLLEMLIVVAIIAVLAAIALSIFSGAMEKAKKETCAANRRSLKATLTAAYMTGGEDAVAAEYEKEGADFTCPSGGKLTYTLDTATGVVTVRCSLEKHQGDEGGTDSADAKLAVTKSGFNSVFSSFDSKYSGKKDITVSSKDMSNKNSDAYKFYSGLSDEQKAFLDQYNWSIKKTYNSQSGTYTQRIFFTDKANTGKNVTIYKYDPAADSNYGQFQLITDGSVQNNGLNYGKNYWGAYDENGQFVYKAWSTAIQTVPSVTPSPTK